MYTYIPSVFFLISFSFRSPQNIEYRVPLAIQISSHQLSILYINSIYIDIYDGWHHQFNGYKLGCTPGDGEGQGGLVCCSPWGGKELDTTLLLKNKCIYANSNPPILPTPSSSPWYLYICFLHLCLYFCFANKFIYTIFLDSTVC